MKKGKLKYIIIITVLIVYAVVMYLAFGVSETRERKATTTLLVGNSAVWNYSSRNWFNMNTSSLLSTLNWQKFNIYVNNQYFGKYLVWQDDQWYLFDNNRNAISYDGNLFAYQADFDMDILNFTTNNITDYTYVNQVLQEHGFDTNVNYTLATVSDVDFDKDGIAEEFYIVSNVFAIDFFPDKYFSFVFMVDNNKIYMLYEDVDTNEGVNGCKPSLYTVADVDNDKEYELILTCAKYSNQTPLTMLYEFRDDAFEIEISNQ